VGGQNTAYHDTAYDNPVTLVPGALYSVGGLLSLDGTVSWAPPEATGYQPQNTYVFLGSEAAGSDPLLIDPGIPAVGSGVINGLAQLLEQNSPLSVFLSRAQFDSAGNLGALMRKYEVREIFTGGLRNRFDQFEEATSMDESRVRPVVLERSPQESRLEILGSSLRILSTYWGYDLETKTVFTSDSFSHGIVHDSDDTLIIDQSTVDRTTIADVRSHLHASFWWLPYANTSLIIDDIQKFFSNRDVEIVAPARGRILVGAEVVQRHLDMVLSVLEESLKGAA
jgi:hypothetical protein